MKNIKENNFCDFFDKQSEEDYEQSHHARLDFLVEDLELDKISNSRVADFGCGYGCTFKRMPKDRDNLYFGWDGYRNKAAAAYCDYRVVNFDNKFADDFLKENEQVDVAFCFETIEHVQNPYNMLYEIKKILDANKKNKVGLPKTFKDYAMVCPQCGSAFSMEQYRCLGGTS